MQGACSCSRLTMAMQYIFLIRLFHALMDSACRATFCARSLLYFYFYTFLFFFFGFGVRNRMYIPP